LKPERPSAARISQEKNSLRGSAVADAMAMAVRTSDIYRYPLQTSAFATDPLPERRQLVQQEFDAGPSAVVHLDTTVFDSSPLQDFVDQAQQDVIYGLNPLGQLAESVKAVHTPSYTRGQYQMVSGEDLRVTVELGPLLWHHTERGSAAGQLIDTFA
jgi:hypothetical protein